MVLAAFPPMPPPPELMRISSSRPASHDVCLPRCVEAVPCRGSRNGRLPSPVPAFHGDFFVAPSDAHASASPRASGAVRSSAPPSDAYCSLLGPHFLKSCVAAASAPVQSCAAFREQGDPPPAAPRRGGPRVSADQRGEANSDKLQALRAEIERIERGSPHSLVSAAALRRHSAYRAEGVGAWDLDRQATHEIKPAVPDLPAVSAAGFAAALAFGLRLAAQPRFAGDRGAILFCATSDILREAGRLYGPGLDQLGVACEQLLIVETEKSQQTLWAMEEGLKSQALSAVVGCLDAVALTPARRLSLAAKAYAMPCLFVTGARTPTAGATARRWRVGLQPGASSPFDEDAPGDGCGRIVLEKLRSPSSVLSGCVPGTASIEARAGILQAGRFHDLSSRADGQDPGSRSSVAKPVSGDAMG